MNPQLIHLKPGLTQAVITLRDGAQRMIGHSGCLSRANDYFLVNYGQKDFTYK